MFMHNFKYSLKTLFKNKMLIFWTFAFPIILGTFFSMAFSNIEKKEKLDIIDIAVVKNDEFKTNKIFSESFKELSKKDSKNRLFNTKYVSLSKAKKLLSSNKITGYFILDNSPKVVVNQNGINETILKNVIDEISSKEDIFKNVTEKKIKENNGVINYNEIYNEAINIINEDNVNIKNISSKNLSYMMIEFYTLIAMAALYGGILAMAALNKNLANMSNTGKRISVSCVSKSKLIISSILSSYLVQLIGILLLFIYTIFVLKVDYGNNIALVILLAFISCFSGLSFGTMVTTVFLGNENTKTGIIIAFTMLGCFFSGMMGVTMKYIIDKNIPILNKLNPANMITDGFYSLYYYSTLNRYYFNILSLLIFAFIMIGISMFSLRRQKYDSI